MASSTSRCSISIHALFAAARIGRLEPLSLVDRGVETLAAQAREVEGSSAPELGVDEVAVRLGRSDPHPLRYACASPALIAPQYFTNRHARSSGSLAGRARSGPRRCTPWSRPRRGGIRWVVGHPDGDLLPRSRRRPRSGLALDRDPGPTTHRCPVQGCRGRTARSPGSSAAGSGTSADSSSGRRRNSTTWFSVDRVVQRLPHPFVVERWRADVETERRAVTGFGQSTT